MQTDFFVIFSLVRLATEEAFSGFRNLKYYYNSLSTIYYITTSPAFKILHKKKYRSIRKMYFKN